VERALAAYNAGPHRVVLWTAADPDMPPDEFIENIAFSETRHYVRVVLANQAHYRRLYSLAPSARTARSDP
jgi:soluble lytic murein transglycosylase